MSKKHNLYFLVLMLIATFIIFGDNIFTYKRSKQVAEDTSRLQLLGIGVSLEAIIQQRGVSDLKNEQVFQKIVSEGRWEGVAFIVLYDDKHTILLHSNQNLIGRKLKETSLESQVIVDDITYGYLTLGTLERVFVMDMQIHSLSEKLTLRVATHTHEINRIIEFARVKILAMTVVLIILWSFYFIIWRYTKNAEQLQEKIARQEKLAAIGQMSAILAHEIRNPIGSIKGFAQYMLESDAMKDEEALNIIIKESKRIENLVEELLYYSKPIDVKVERFYINELIEEVVNIYSSDRTKFILKNHLKKTISSDRDKLKQVFINIINNAIEAMQYQGSIEISIFDHNEGAVVTIKDFGCGIDKELKEKIFTPFFTTKAKGTGLGLAIVKNIIDALNCEISFKSEKDKGTEFTILIRDIGDEHKGF
ncbi:MAG: ATP-binding protein [Thermodesulfovibrionales bacterium]|nr:ATP-binding protein [Thermodesulfovibrionales bacterium]